MNPSAESATPVAKPLFRIAVLSQAGQRRYGTVLLARPISYAYLTVMFVTITGALVLFFALFSFTRKAQIPGVLLPSDGLIRVVPMQAGVVTERRAAEGAVVKANDVLFVLASERANAKDGNAEQTISNLLKSRRDSFLSEQSQLRRQSTQRMDAAGHRVDSLGAEIARLDEQVDLQQRRAAIAEATLQRYADLQASNFVSPAAVQDKQAELLDQQQRVSDLKRVRSASVRDRAAAQAELRDLQVQSQRDQEAGQRSVAAVEQDLTENEARRQVFVRAPHDGVVSAITVEPGQSVSANQSLATIIPSGSQLEAELYAPSRSAGFLRPGMQVLLRYQAYSYQKFGQSRGTVREVSTTAMRPEDLSLPGATLPPGSAAEPFYRVRVSLDRQTVQAYGVPQPLRAGAVIDASVLLETRRLYEWVLEPLYTITGRV
jgi:membrane fusion protein